MSKLTKKAKRYRRTDRRTDGTILTIEQIRFKKYTYKEAGMR